MIWKIEIKAIQNQGDSHGPAECFGRKGTWENTLSLHGEDYDEKHSPSAVVKHKCRPSTQLMLSSQ